MNLIEIAEDLKDVPDRYLMQEVQQPTGNYPAYLVISELGRRKRMRDSAMKDMPKTTVAQDLTAPQRQQAMAQMAQDQNMVQQAGGLNALPQAQQDLAAMDMLSAQPQMPQEIPAMAGGGMVSFSNGGMPDTRGIPSMEEEVGRRLSMDYGGMSARAVRKPEGYEVRGSADMGGLRPFIDVGGNLRPSMYGVEFNRPIEGGSMRGVASYDPETRERVLSGEMQRRLSRDSEIAARGRYSPDSGYNVGLDYRRRFNEGGEVIRAFNGLPQEMFEPSPRSSLDPYVAPGTPLPNTVGVLRRLGETFPTTGRLFGMEEDRLYIDPVTKEPITYQEFLNKYYKYPQSSAETTRLQSQRSTTPAVAPGAAPAAGAGPTGTTAGAPAGAPSGVPGPRAPVPQSKMPAISMPDALTPYALSTIGAQAVSDYEQAVPDRTTKYFTEDIARREADIKKRRETNINDALIQAGLGAMRTKPKFSGTAGLFEIIGAGGQAGFDVLRQGRKDLRESEEAINAARAKMIESEILRDERKYKASNDARKEAIELNNYGLNRAKTESAIALQTLQGNIAAQKAPYEIEESQARAKAYGLRGAPKPLTAQEIMMLRPQAIAELKRRGITNPSSEQINQQIAIMRNPELAVEAPALDRGNI